MQSQPAGQSIGMNEALLQFIWQNQYFNRSALLTSDMDEVEVIHPGTLNLNQGPDFLDARVRIGRTLWCGPVELHVRSGDWVAHGHTGDPLYQNVILHVVWADDVRTGSAIPVLELAGRVPRVLEDTYLGWMRNLRRIPCEEQLLRYALSPSRGWMAGLLEERLLRRSEELTARLSTCGGDWETAFWWQLARSFGYRVNADAFEEMARSLPMTLLARHRQSIQQLEALLLGQCGLLEVRPTDPYVSLLQREYRFLKHKYGLHPVKTHVKFLRMRPQNFPTVRLAQLAMLLHRIERPFSRLLAMETPQEASRLLTVTANDFWHYHYRLEKSSAFMEKTLGQEMVANILVNTVVPFLYAYGRQALDIRQRYRALQWLRESCPERNAPIRVFLEAGCRVASAADTQALLHLEREYCSRRRCLECDIGQRLMKGDFSPVPEVSPEKVPDAISVSEPPSI
jgi:hypothetical protein